MDIVKEFAHRLPKKRILLKRPAFDKKFSWSYSVPKQADSQLICVKNTTPLLIHKGLYYPFSLTINYKCMDPCSDNQRVMFLGLIVTVWHHSTGLVAESHTCRPGISYEGLLRVLHRLVGKVNKRCIHSHTKHIARSGNCLNVYRCLDCGVVFELDSSD